MMVRFIKFLIQILVNYLNTSNSKLKYDIAQYSVVLAILPINYLIFHYIIHSTSLAWIILFSIGSGRLLNAWIMERHNCDFGEGWNTTLSVPLRYMSYSAIILLTFIAFFMLLKDGYENYSVLDRVKDTSEKPAYVTSDYNETNSTFNRPYSPYTSTMQLQSHNQTK